jgi:Family of unknown function (DUF5681)
MKSIIEDDSTEKQSIWAELPSFVERGDGYIDGWKPSEPSGDASLNTLLGELYADIAVKYAREVRDPAFVGMVMAAIYFRDNEGPDPDGRDRTRFSEPDSAPGLCGVAELMPIPENTGRKQGNTRFKPGKSGNPDGRPRGSRNVTTVALETLLDGQATALTQKAIDLALTGDMAALRRSHPAATERPACDVRFSQDHHRSRGRHYLVRDPGCRRCRRDYPGRGI